VICLESLVVNKGVVIQACGHSFHRGYLANWLKEGNTCPIRRKVLCREERAKTLWEEMEDSAYFIAQLGDVRVLAGRGVLLERLVGEKVRVIGEPGEWGCRRQPEHRGLRLD
jgi:hypothetical protein